MDTNQREYNRIIQENINYVKRHQKVYKLFKNSQKWFSVRVKFQSLECMITAPMLLINIMIASNIADFCYTIMVVGLELSCKLIAGYISEHISDMDHEFQNTIFRDVELHDVRKENQRLRLVFNGLIGHGREIRTSMSILTVVSLLTYSSLIIIYYRAYFVLIEFGKKVGSST